MEAQKSFFPKGSGGSEKLLELAKRIFIETQNDFLSRNGIYTFAI